MAQPPIPKLAQYWANAISVGVQHGNALTDATFVNQATAEGFTPGTPEHTAKVDDLRVNHIYYDMSSVMWDIRDYGIASNDMDAQLASEFQAFALQADSIYLDKYLIPANFVAQGFRIFPDGFKKSFQKTGNFTKRAAAVSLSTQAAFARDSTANAEMVSAFATRETAYALYSWLIAEELGESPRARKAEYINLLFGHFSQWFTARTYTPIVPFMVALASRTLIKLWFSQGGSPAADTRIIPTLLTAWEEIWSTLWVSSAGAFRYQSVANDDGGTQPEVDLNLLIVPVFGFLWYTTGDKKWQDRGNVIFSNGVTEFDQFGVRRSGAFIGDGKQFCQQYLWTGDYITWASSNPLTATPPPPTSEPSLLVQVAPSMLLPVRRETWRDRYAPRGWVTWRDQVEAGYPLLAQPGGEMARFTEVVDLGALVSSGARITLGISQNVIAGIGGITETEIEYSANGIDFVNVGSGSDIFAINFRYIKVDVEWGGDDKYIARTNPLSLIVNAKEKREAGVASTLASDFATGGSIVPLVKSFADIETIRVSARYEDLGGGAYPVAFHNFLDVPNPTTFKIFTVNSQDGTPVDGVVDYEVLGV